MSPGATFERVYLELGRLLAEGRFPQGAHLEPRQLGRELAASITPVRDALHRLTGERIVEAPRHNGFSVPRWTEAALRDAYGWRAVLLRLAVRKMRFEALPPPDRHEAATAPAMFVAIACATGSAEHRHAIEQLNRRLSPLGRFEAIVLGSSDAEAATLGADLAAGLRGPLAGTIERYHRRRSHAVPKILGCWQADGTAPL